MFVRLNANIDMFDKALDGLWLRDKVINHNISNVNTPNYKRLTVDFEDKLKEAIKNSETKLRRTHTKHLPISSNINDINANVVMERNHSYRFDRNNVNIDTEMAELSKNTIMYNAVINQVIGEFDKIKNVISEGSK